MTISAQTFLENMDKLGDIALDLYAASTENFQCGVLDLDILENIVRKAMQLICDELQIDTVEGEIEEFSSEERETNRRIMWTKGDE